MEDMRKKIGKGLARIQEMVWVAGILSEKGLNDEWNKVGLPLELTYDDWIENRGTKYYPAETASIALTQRDEKGNIIATGIAALYRGFPIVIADKQGLYFYRKNQLMPVISIDRKFIDSTVEIRCHVFAQKSKLHWAWMNNVIAELNKAGIKTDNNMGPYFILRDFLYYIKEVKNGIIISPIKAVISEPYLNKPKEEVGAFVIRALNQGLPEGKKFFISNMSGEELFTNDAIKRVDLPTSSIYCASGWIAGPTKELVRETLEEMKKAVKKIRKPAEANTKIEELLENFND